MMRTHRAIQRMFILAIACMLPMSVVAQSRTTNKMTYETMGGPANPKVAAYWNRYHDYRQATKLLQELAAKHPEYVRLQSQGKSYGGRDMWVMTITNFNAEGGDRRPGFWIDGGIHANEIQSVEVVLYTAWFLAEMAGNSDFIDELLNERIFYLCPMLSPDSRDAHFYEPNTTHSPRTGQRPFDDDRDGQVDEDGYDDLNNDGHITMMRIKDDNGTHKPDPKFPGRMLRTEAGEKGSYRLLGVEGLDNDGDGRVNEDGDGSYDPNRDWGWNWQPSYVQRGAHRYPFSIDENRVIAEFIAAHTNIAGAQSYHNAGGMILRGPGAKTDRYERSDIQVYDKLGAQGAEMLPKYRYMNIANDLYEVYGGEVDWLHQNMGVYAFTNELFTGWNFFRSGEESTGFFGSEESRHKFDRYLLMHGGVIEWEEIDHPQYGKVEVGGLKKNWLRQPPSFLLEEELHRNMAFTLFHADEMPQVSIQSAKLEKLSDSLTQVTAIIENKKIIPTHSAINLKHRLTRPDLVSIKGDGIKVHLGMTSRDPFFESPTEQKRKPAEIRVRNIRGRGLVYVRWLVSGNGPFDIKVDSIKGGQATHTLTAEEPTASQTATN